MAEPAMGSVVTAIVTRAREQADLLATGLEDLGMRVILSPAIRFEEPSDWAPFDGAAASAGSWDWVILTSANGVRAATARLRLAGSGWGAFSRARFVAIGPATARAMEIEGVVASLVPEEFRAEGILDAIGSRPLDGSRILLARAEKAREILPEELRRRGAEILVAAVYRTLPCAPSTDAIEALRAAAGPGLIVIFTSPSTVEHFIDGLPPTAREALGRATLASIGPITAQALASRGLVAAIQPASYTVPALIEELRARRPPA